MYDTLTTPTRSPAPCTARRTCGSRASAGSRSCRARTHPAVYRVEFACGCGHEHPGLVTHDDLDWAPLGVQDETTFVNLMTSRVEPIGERARRSRRGADQGGGVAVELLLLAGGAAAARVPVGVQAARAGGDRRPRRRRRALPGVREGVGQPRLARARRRAVRERPRGGGGGALFEDDAAATLEEFRAELWSGAFDAAPADSCCTSVPSHEGSCAAVGPTDTSE